MSKTKNGLLSPRSRVIGHMTAAIKLTGEFSRAPAPTRRTLRGALSGEQGLYTEAFGLNKGQKITHGSVPLRHTHTYIMVK